MESHNVDKSINGMKPFCIQVQNMSDLFLLSTGRLITMLIVIVIDW